MSTTNSYPPLQNAGVPVTPGGDGGHGGGEHHDDEGGRVHHVQLLLYIHIAVFALIAAYALVRLPHLFALFKSPSEWRKGHILHRSKSRQTKTGRNGSTRATLTRSHTVGRTANGTIDPFEKNISTTTLVGVGVGPAQFPAEYKFTLSDSGMREERGGAHPRRVKLGPYPTHVGVVPKALRSLLVLSRARILGDYSVSQVIVLGLYFGVLLFASFFQSDPFTDGERTGFVALWAMPLIYALAQKSNIIGSLLGYGYEKLNYLHRFIGRLAIIAGNLHSLYYFYKWLNAGKFATSIMRPSNAYGTLALFCFDVLWIFSTDYWRRRAYNVFLWSHVICSIGVLPVLYLHKPKLLPYIIASAVCYGLDRVMRLVKTRVCTAKIFHLQQLNATQVQVRGLTGGWRAGQHVRLRILSSGMGWLGWTEIHPFTIASASDSDDGLVLLCKNAGDWTERLGLMAKRKGYDRGESNVKVWIEGPYGGPSRMMFESFSAAILVCGGSGIAFGIAMAQDIVEKELKGQSRVKYVEVIWVCQDPESVMALLPAFNSLIEQSYHTPIRISVYYTRALTSTVSFSSNPDAVPHFPMTVGRDITVSPGRPSFDKALDSAIISGLNRGQESTGVAVGVCGPVGLGRDVARAVAKVDAVRRDRVGGIEIHEETFGW